MLAPALSLGFYLFGLASRRIFYAGFLLQTGYLMWRGVSLGRLPLVGVHDTLTFLSASIAGFSLAFHPALKDRDGFYRMLSGLCAVFSAGALFQPPYSRPLAPVLNTYWFELHVAASFMSYALFGIAAVLAVQYLRGRGQDLERMHYKAVFVGYGLFSFSMFTGGIWAFYAWGTYWLWTPKELWTSIVWVFYGFYLHARIRPGWQGVRTSALAIAGFALSMFTYLGVGLLMKSSHSF